VHWNGLDEPGAGVSHVLYCTADHSSCRPWTGVDRGMTGLKWHRQPDWFVNKVEWTIDRIGPWARVDYGVEWMINCRELDCIVDFEVNCRVDCRVNCVVEVA